MQAYHGNQELKDQLVALSIEHREKDQYIKGTFGEENINEALFKGCSVGCTVMDICNIEDIDPADVDFSDHGFLAEKLGVPVFATQLQDTFFENVSNEKRKSWTTEFFLAIQPGANLEPVLPKFLKFVLEQTLPCVSDEKFTDQKNAVLGSIKVINNWMQTGQKDTSAAASAEFAVEFSADCAAISTADYAAWPTERAAIFAAESATFDFYADKFLELIKSA